ncbi:hypothetical protein IPM19_04750 [bacterium]|nr:MAG: hypothetical protein IPM19_04750 [bacterium]
MTARLSLSSAVEKVILMVAFLPVVTMVYPETAAAALAVQNSGEKALVFQVNSKQKTEIIPATTGLSYDELVQNDILVKKVKAYLESKGSPLAIYSDEIVKQPQWQRALAISFVESNFGKRCANNNCSGIGVSPSHPSWRRYATKLDWFKDMSALLEKPTYKQKYTTCAKMKGVYVVPGSARWVNGCNKVSEELLAITAQAEQERLALANQPNVSVAVHELALVK